MSATDAAVERFKLNDYDRLDRSHKAAQAEIDALRQLVRDMVAGTVPNLCAMSADGWRATDWQPRAQRACASMSLMPERCESDDTRTVA